MILIAVIAALVLLGGCGAAAPRQANVTPASVRDPGVSRDHRPLARPPRQPSTPAPPPAWVHTPQGSRWLAYGSYCWSAHGHGACADMVGPELRHDVPTLVVRSGDPVRFHLAFTAPSADVYLGHGAKSVLRRRATRLVAWRAPSGRGDRVVMLEVGAPGAGGSASYLALLRVR